MIPRLLACWLAACSGALEPELLDGATDESLADEPSDAATSADATADAETIDSGVHAVDASPSASPDGGGPESDGGHAGSVVAPCGHGVFEASVERAEGSWVTANGTMTVYRGDELLAAMRAAVASLTPGRTAQERVVVRGSGSIQAASSLDLPSHTSLEVCGTIDVVGAGTGDNAVVRIRNAEDVAVPYLRVTGSPWFGVFVRNGRNIHLGQIELRLSGGLGVRIDNHGNRSIRTEDVRIDHVYVEGTDNHGVETYGVDRLSVGTVVARNTGYSGLLLNDTTHAKVGLVDAIGAGTGTGYAAFRMANRNGRVNEGYETNIVVGEVRARAGGRGIFCVSESGGAVIERVDIADTGTGPAIFIEDCYNVTIARDGGSLEGGSERHGIRIAARSPGGAHQAFLGYSDGIRIENMAVNNASIVESPCGGDNTVRNNTLTNTPLTVCAGTAK